MKKIAIILSIICICIFYVVQSFGWQGLTAEDGDILVFTKWNELLAYVNTKLDTTNIIAGDNITISVDGNDVIIHGSPGTIITVASNRDDTDLEGVRYYGASYSDGSWKIDRETGSGTTIIRDTATYLNNTQQIDYVTAWGNREVLNY